MAPYSQEYCNILPPFLFVKHTCISKFKLYDLFFSQTRRRTVYHYINRKVWSRRERLLQHRTTPLPYRTKSPVTAKIEATQDTDFTIFDQ